MTANAVEPKRIAKINSNSDLKIQWDGEVPSLIRNSMVNIKNNRPVSAVFGGIKAPHRNIVRRHEDEANSM